MQGWVPKLPGKWFIFVDQLSTCSRSLTRSKRAGTQPKLNMKPTTSFFLLAICCALLPFSCKKEESGSISGYVRALDNQAPVEGATVYLREYTRANKNEGKNFPAFNSPDTDRPWVTDSTLTDKNGFYHFESLYPIMVFTAKKHYFIGAFSNSSVGITEKSDNAVDLQLEPYAWIKFRGHNVSGAYKLLVYGADDKGYELIVPQNETGEMILPGRNGNHSSYVYLRGPNNEVILPPPPDYMLPSMHVECSYRDTTLFEMDY